jgi:hypothetical protein
MINVDLKIEGMIALFFEHGTGGQPIACQAGVLKDAPGHQFDLKINRLGGPTIPTGPIDEALNLEVSPDPSITFAQGAINRQDGTGASKSFEWVLDFSGPEVYNFQIGSSKNGFQKILRINSGEFYTEEKSENKLIFFDEMVGSCRNVGIVATVVGVSIELAPGQMAKFFNGGTELFRATPADQFEIKLLNNDIQTASAIQRHGDANFFYTAVGHKIGAGKKKIFSSTPFPPGAGPVTPEASCLVPKGGNGPIELP